MRFFFVRENMQRKSLKNFNLINAKRLIKEDGVDKFDETHFKSLIGCLMYLTSTRSNILFLVSLLSRFMHCVSELHLKATREMSIMESSIARYKTLNYQDFLVVIWQVAWMIQRILQDTISMSLRKQEVVAHSTAKAEFVATIVVVANLGLKQKKFVDNQIIISISYNSMFYRKTKHFNVKLLYLREVQENGDISLIYCKTEYQAADMLTKFFSLSRFEFLRKKLGICSLQSKEEF
ncbi:hypothetical protein CR513_24576, partial [Mucuna pruriens]